MSRWPRPPVWLVAAALVLGLWLALIYLPLFFGHFPRTIDALDFGLYYVGAKVGLHDGWSHIYDLGRQREFFLQARPGDVFDWRRYFVSPPPAAWLVVPLAVLPLDLAFWIWSGVGAAAFLALGWLAAPARGLARIVVVAAGATLYPVLLAVQNGNLALLMGAACLLGWVLLVRGHRTLAGLALALLAIKPQVAVLVPVALLVAGEVRVGVVAIAAMSVLAAVSLATLGADGAAQLRSDLAQESGRAANLLWTLRLVAPAPLAAILQAAALVAALLAAWRARARPAAVETAFAAGIAGTLLAAPYHNATDFLALVPAAWLLLRSGGRLRWAWAGFGVLACYAAAALGPWPVLLFAAGLLALCYGGGVAGTMTTRPEASEV